MPLIQVIVLAAVQGITEFLPVSSTAHLALIPWLLHWKDPGLAFDVALHVGTLAAVLLYFLKEWVDLTLAGFGMKPLFSSERRPGQALELGYHRALIWFLAIATIPAGVAGWLFHEQVETTWRSPFIIAAAMILVAVVMAWGEKAGSQEKGLESVGLADSLWIGFSQAIALVPGVSRSGITITGGLFRGLKRETAARFSFLLSTPIDRRGGSERTLRLSPSPGSRRNGHAVRVGSAGLGHRGLRDHLIFPQVFAIWYIQDFHLLPDLFWHNSTCSGVFLSSRVRLLNHADGGVCPSALVGAAPVRPLFLPLQSGSVKNRCGAFVGCCDRFSGEL